MANSTFIYGFATVDTCCARTSLIQPKNLQRIADAPFNPGMLKNPRGTVSLL